MVEVPGTEQIMPADLVLLAMGFVSPVAGMLEAFGVERDARGNAKAHVEAEGGYATNVDEGVRRRRHAPRPVARGLGDPRRPPGGARGRRVPDGFEQVAALSMPSPPGAAAQDECEKPRGAGRGRSRRLRLRGVAAHHPRRRVDGFRPRQGHGHSRRLGQRQDDAAAPDRRRSRPAQRCDPLRRRAGRPERPGAPVRDPPPPRHAVPVRRALHRPVGVRERRLPAARAHRLRRVDDPRHRPDEAQRRRPARRGAAAHRRDLGRHGATRRAGPGDGARSRAAALRRAVHRARPDLAWPSPPT